MQISRECTLSNNVENRSLHNDIKLLKRRHSLAELIIYHCIQKNGTDLKDDKVSLFEGG